MDQPIKRRDADPVGEPGRPVDTPGERSVVDPAPYRAISIQRPPRTLWERIRARFGARFFEVRSERPDGEA